MKIIISFAIFILFCSTHLIYAKNFLLPGESLYPNQSLVSQNGEFKFGVGEDGYDLIGIWLRLEDLDWRYVWVANTENNVNESQPYVSLSQNGDLNFTRSHNQLIWSTDLTKNEQVSTILVLLDTGNLVLRDRMNSNKVIWQSFDQPTDTWLPGAWLGFSSINGKNIALSLVSCDYGISLPCSGDYSLEIDNSTGKWGFMVTEIYSNISYFGTFPSWLPIQCTNGLITINSTESPRFHVTLNSSRGINIWKGAELLYGYRESTLDCGPFGLRISNFSDNLCKCPYGFRPTSYKEFAVGNYNGGCVRNISWSCNTHSSLDSDNFRFHLLDGLIWRYCPEVLHYRGSKSQEDCEKACLTNCSCTAYSIGENTCYLLYGELWNITINDDMLTGESIYIRLAISNSTIRGTMNKNIKLIIGGVLVIVIVCSLFFWIFGGKFLCVKPVNIDDYLSVYTYKQIKKATKSFSSKLGEGGFGSVFEGRLFDRTKVAVKKLKIVGQEEKQFRAEVQTLGMIRHTNLVSLLGFCAEGHRRILVYEYMSWGSLDTFLFKERSIVLSWKGRYKIATGIARGLAYLHEECRDCIIHCDIKPENVLLDEHFLPKIADFGLAKFFGRDFSRVLTTMRGTIGYLAPEWISGEAITQKADVYSFGMMLFEIISGKRNTSKFNNRRYPYFPLYATIKINEGDFLCLADEKMGRNLNVVELARLCMVAGWCIQDSEAHRPSMGKVVLMLQGVMDVDIPPVPSSLLNLVDADDY